MQVKDLNGKMWSIQQIEGQCFIYYPINSKSVKFKCILFKTLKKAKDYIKNTATPTYIIK